VVPVVNAEIRVRVLLGGADLPQNAFAVFQVRENQDAPVQAYGLAGDQVEQLNLGVEDSQLFPSIDPSGEILAYISVGTDGQHALVMANLSDSESTPLFADTQTLTVGEYPITWSPDGLSLLVTLIDSGGAASVYAIDVSNPDFIPPPVLLVNDATSAAISPNGQYLAFERSGQDRRDVYLMLLVNRTTNPLTSQPGDSACLTPAFGADSLSLYFVCQAAERQEIYRYGMQGVLEFETNVETPANPAPGPVDGFLAFDDGNSLYLATFADAQVTPMVQFEDGGASGLRWQASS
jgi:Tol biopolymer transport system component